MAIKKTTIHIENFGTGNNRFKVFSDLEPYQIQRIDGVHNVSDILRDEGYLIATIDKRFDIQEVLDEIKLLAEDT